MGFTSTSLGDPSLVSGDSDDVASPIPNEGDERRSAVARVEPEVRAPESDSGLRRGAVSGSVVLTVRDNAGAPAEVRIGLAAQLGGDVTWVGSTDGHGGCDLARLINGDRPLGFVVVEASRWSRCWVSSDALISDPALRDLTLPACKRVHIEVRGLPPRVVPIVWFGRRSEVPFPEPPLREWLPLEVADTIHMQSGELLLPKTITSALKASAAGYRVTPNSYEAPFPPRVVFDATEDADDSTLACHVRIRAGDGSIADVDGLCVMRASDGARLVRIIDGQGQPGARVMRRYADGWCTVVDDTGELWIVEADNYVVDSGQLLVTCDKGQGERAAIVKAPSWDVDSVYLLYADGRIKGVAPLDAQRRGRPCYRLVGDHIHFYGLSAADPSAALWLLAPDGRAVTGSAGEVQAGGNLRNVEVERVEVRPSIEGESTGPLLWHVRLPGQAVDLWLRLSSRPFAELVESTPWIRFYPVGGRYKASVIRNGRELSVMEN
ncbi:MAG TPA: hypothetical protein ENI87_06625 [bacterium]|nr:hypothetical protein [bacterium]